MRVLVDTHTFLWALLEDKKLSQTARQILTSDSHELVFSLVSLWEVSIKIKTGKLNTLGSSCVYVHDEMESYGMELLPIRYEHILALEILPLHHKDPFDRLLIAQAMAESIPILTRDEKFPLYPVELIW
jgi:PIN domain nuclease of toxin-antitoxin system